jgi:alpha-amylase
MYHNRGDSTFAGESSLYGDFAGLDDLFTERREVVDGMIDIYRFWVREFGVDGFRIDTVKHVNTEFWQRFAPAILDEAHRAGKDEFFMFGEVFDTSRPFLSSFTTRARLQSVLDFAFQRGAQDFAAGSAPTDRLRDLFLGDDWFTDRDSNAYQLPTFLGNHDMGRIGFFTARDNPGAADEELLARDRLAHALMFFSRGMPVVYYGDEQGFTGGGQGNDQLARQDMFPSQTQEYWDDDSIGTDATPKDDNFDTAHPLYRAIGSLADLTKAHPALRDGAQQHRWSSPAAGIYAFSRTRAREQVEYVVALNNAEEDRSAAVPTASAGMAFAKLHGPGPQALTSGADRTLALTVPPLSAVVYRAEDRTARSRRAPRIAFAAPAQGAEVTRRAELRADVAGGDFAEVTFALRERGSGGWWRLGTDDNAPYRVFADLSRYDAGTRLELLAVVRDNAGHSRSTRRIVRVGDAGAPLAPAVVHYLRSDGDYTDWGLHLFGDAIAEGLGTSREAPRPPDGIDADGAFWRLGLKDEEASVNFIVHTPSGDEVPLTREPGGDRSWVPAETREIWLRQGDPNVYTARPPAG